MKPDKIYIITISSDLSQRYARDTIKSLETTTSLPYEIFNGTENKSAYNAWMESGLSVKMDGVYKFDKVDKAACASVSHALLWKQIVENRETAIILEHDALLLQSADDMDIPDNAIITLGYKIKDPSKYDHRIAGLPKKLNKIVGHEGAHAYVITWKTAALMLEELKTSVGVSHPVDNSFFLQMRLTSVPLFIADPTPAVAWIRESTIWPVSAELNYPFIESFKSNYKE